MKTLTQVSNMAAKDWRKGVQLIDQNMVPELSRCKEEGVTLLQRHRGAELRLVIVVAQMCNLVQVAETF